MLSWKSVLILLFLVTYESSAMILAASTSSANNSHRKLLSGSIACLLYFFLPLLIIYISSLGIPLSDINIFWNMGTIFLLSLYTYIFQGEKLTSGKIISLLFAIASLVTLAISS